MKKATKVLLICLCVLAVIVLAGFIALKQVGGNPDDIALGNLNLSDTADGTYQGEYATTLVSAQVEVLVKDGEISHIEILDHDHGPNHGADVIIEDVVETQSLDVDAVSGSTMSSKVILKAV